ncbi:MULTISPECIES: DUF29 domain-containing protein [unclassified Endozoicomonas]|uniref:DUF29 domain-containing protein n=1 Tax=unclassified Endozoicomonas TaxID=2644528 RepID=UPI003BB72E8A
MESSKHPLYHSDYPKWLALQRTLLAERRFDELDIDNLLHTMEYRMGDFVDELESHLVNLLLHLLKHHYQTQVINPRRDEPQEFRSWFDNIDSARGEISRLLNKHPYLKSHQDEAVVTSYPYAKKRAIKQMNQYLPHEQWLTDTSFPEACPWPWEQLLDEDWLP